MPRLLSAVLTVLCVAANNSAGEEPSVPSVEKLVKRCDERLHTFHGIEFKYHVSWQAHIENELREIETINFFRLADPIDPQSYQHRFLHTQTVENPGEPMLDGDRVTRCWYGYDGHETRYFKQTFLTDDPPGLRMSTGIIRPGFSNSFSSKIKDSFPYLLTMDIVGWPGYFYIEDPDTRFEIFKIEFASLGRSLGHQTFNLLRKPRAAEKHAMAKPGNVEVLATSVPLVTRHSSGEYSEVGDFGGRAEITEIGQFEKIMYPKSGRRVQALGTALMRCEFEVLAVRRLSDEELEHWFPEWPEGTSVRDEGPEKLINYPYSASKSDAIRRFRMKRFADTPTDFSKLAIIAVNVVAIAVIAIFVYRRATGKA